MIVFYLSLITYQLITGIDNIDNTLSVLSMQGTMNYRL